MKADMHIHTTFSSDGSIDPYEAVEVAVERGFGCIAISDHNSFEAYDLIKDDGRLIVVPAIEVSSSEGHILAYGIDREIQPRLSARETIEEIHDAGGYAFAAHPYRWWSGLGEEATLSNPFDGIEAGNARSYRRDNRSALALSKIMGCPVSAGSDAHTIDQLGKGYIVLPDGLKTWQEVIETMMSSPQEIVTSNRSVNSTLRYGVKAIGLWASRGFRRM